MDYISLSYKLQLLVIRGKAREQNPTNFMWQKLSEASVIMTDISYLSIYMKNGYIETVINLLKEIVDRSITGRLYNIFMDI